MRGIFWWNRKLDRSWKTMEKDTSLFKTRRKPAARSGKSQKKYPKLHRTVKPHDERFDAPSTDIVGVLVLCICLAWITLPLVILLHENVLCAAGILLMPKG